MIPNGLPDPSTLQTVAEILAVRSRLPKVRSGDLLQAYKAALAVRVRAIRVMGLQSVTLPQVLRLVVEAPTLCPVCSEDMKYWASNRVPSLDHIIPVSKGGDNSWVNLRIICNRCNSKKGNRT